MDKVKKTKKESVPEWVQNFGSKIIDDVVLCVGTNPIKSHKFGDLRKPATMDAWKQNKLKN